MSAQDVTMDKWSILEERITRLVDSFKRLKAGNTQLQNELKRQNEELDSKIALVNQLQEQNRQLQQVNEEHHRHQEEREEICRRLEMMLSELEQVQLETA